MLPTPWFYHLKKMNHDISIEKIIEEVENFLAYPFSDDLFEHYIEQDEIKKVLIRGLKLK